LVPVSYRTSGNCGAWETGDKTDALTTATDPNHHVLAFSSKDHSADAGEIAPTLRAMGHSGSHANAGGQVAVAIQEVGISEPGNPMFTLQAHPQSDSSSRQTGVRIGMSVRRLTPTECERLQGFPDGWTAIKHRKKPAADGPRYKALGNSMAVPVLRWIGERIMWIGQMTDREGEL
jgi:DNA (cytosine-5)-methyltransferase 1